jgi:hypothetical protein
MREIRTWVVIACALAACKGQSGSSAKHQGSGEGGGETDKMEGEISVRLGDCAPAGTPFMAGAEPQAFKPEDVAAPATKLYATAADGGDVLAAYYANDDIYGALLGNEAGEMNGGFGYGRSGFGPGGGTGWGTIGTGKYGTIGHGSGTGYGIGGGRLRAAPQSMDVPSVSIGQPVVRGDLDKAIIRRYIKRNIQKIQYCYEKQLLADPTLAGTVTVSFVIAATGSVTKSDGSGVQKDVSACVADVIRGIEFPKPAGGGIVQVTYPFKFTPGRSVGKYTVIKPATPKPPARKPAPPATPPRSDPQVGAFGSLIDTSIPKSKPYTPGASSPLAELRIALVDCFRRQDKHYAAAVFDLAPGSITVHGIDHPAFAKCLAEMGPQVKVPAPVRCSATFGSAGASTLPSIDITADAITMNGQKVTEPAAVMAGTPEEWWKVESVSKVAQEHVKATLASKDALTVHGPIAVRPLPATPMKIVTKLVHTLVAAGEAPVLAAQRNGNWQLVRNYPLPMLPVPTGTGGSWDSEFGTGALTDSTDEKPHLSVLVDKNDVWVGVSQKNEGKRVPFAKLKDVLVEHKQSATFADREDIQIAGADDVPYSRVVEAIDLASGSGFRAWSLTSPIGLASRPPDDAAAGSGAAGSAAP